MLALFNGYEAPLLKEVGFNLWRIGMPVIRFVDKMGAGENKTDDGCATYMYTFSVP